MYTCTIESQAFSALPVAVRVSFVAALVEVLCTMNSAYLAAFPNTPEIYASGVVYQDQAPAKDPFDPQAETDWWQDIPRLLQTKAGSCEDLAAWRVSELRAQGENASPDVVVQVTTASDGDESVLYHVRVKRGNGQIEDPSFQLGMSAPDDYVQTLGVIYL